MSEIKDIFMNKITLMGDKWEPYFEVYETYFNKFKGKSPTVVEVGIFGGGSMQLWKEYFGKGAKIYGIDINENTLQLELDGVKVAVGDQGNPEFWDEFLKKVPEIDCFVDDGGHWMHQQIVTFLKVWPHISEGGVYICEDTHTSYWKHYGGGFKNEGSMIEFCKNIIDLMHRDHLEDTAPPKELLEIMHDIGSIHFYDSQVVIMKNRKPFNRIIVNSKF
jgi:hypothetical protein